MHSGQTHSTQTNQLLAMLVMALIPNIALTSCGDAPVIDEIEFAEENQGIEPTVELAAKDFVDQDGYVDVSRMDAYRAWVSSQPNEMRDCMDHSVHMREFVDVYESCTRVTDGNSDD